jgi:hypothetical protein
MGAGYLGVWHLKDLSDATSNNPDGTNVNGWFPPPDVLKVLWNFQVPIGLLFPSPVLEPSTDMTISFGEKKCTA